MCSWVWDIDWKEFMREERDFLKSLKTEVVPETLEWTVREWKSAVEKVVASEEKK